MSLLGLEEKDVAPLTEIVKEIDFIQELYAFFKEEKEKHAREPGVVWVTDLISCSLKEKYSRLYPELEMAQLFKPVLVQGTLLHYGLEKVLSDILIEKGWTVEIEKEGTITVNLRRLLVNAPAEDTVIVKGRIDLFVENGKEKFGIEIKTARADLSLPHEHHVDQVKIYNTMFGVEKSYLLYVTPDRVTQYIVRDKMPLQDIAKRIAENTVPRYKWECQYCPFAVLCPHKVTKNKR